MTITSLTGISGIGPQAAKLLYDNGFKTVQAVAKASPEALSKVQGFSAARSEKTIQAAVAMLADTETSSPAPAAPAKEKVAETVAKPARETKKDTADKTKRKIKKLKDQLKKKKLKKKDRKKLQKKLKNLKK